ncbi:MAG: hypothetical protein ACYTKD_26610 [Planctomycetota bacterium]|jgi:hypothetical protein
MIDRRPPVRLPLLIAAYGLLMSLCGCSGPGPKWIPGARVEAGARFASNPALVPSGLETASMGATLEASADLRRDGGGHPPRPPGPFTLSADLRAVAHSADADADYAEGRISAALPLSRIQATYSAAWLEEPRGIDLAGLNPRIHQKLGVGALYYEYALDSLAFEEDAMAVNDATMHTHTARAPVFEASHYLTVYVQGVWQARDAASLNDYEAYGFDVVGTLGDDEAFVREMLDGGYALLYPRQGLSRWTIDGGLSDGRVLGLGISSWVLRLGFRELTDYGGPIPDASGGTTRPVASFVGIRGRDRWLMTLALSRHLEPSYTGNYQMLTGAELGMAYSYPGRGLALLKLGYDSAERSNGPNPYLVKAAVGMDFGSEGAWRWGLRLQHEARRSSDPAEEYSNTAAALFVRWQD